MGDVLHFRTREERKWEVAAETLAEFLRQCGATEAEITEAVPLVKPWWQLMGEPFNLSFEVAPELLSNALAMSEISRISNLIIATMLEKHIPSNTHALCALAWAELRFQRLELELKAARSVGGSTPADGHHNDG